MNKSLSKFMALFKGLDSAYGTYVNNRATTYREPPTEEDFENHLSGKVGIGIVPVKSDNKCNFGAIDIDIDDLDHKDLASKVEISDIPLILCRSKSGGGHLYYFLSGEGQPAEKVRKQLSVWASFLGYGSSEIFPKQDTLAPGEVGNWINLPYFDCENTNRMAFTPKGPLNLKEFIKVAESLKKKNTKIKSQLDEEQKKMAPPCVSPFIHHGQKVAKGERVRNEMLYQMGVFIRKSMGLEVLEDELMKLNYSAFDKPVSAKEVSTIAKSLTKKGYNYKCDSCHIIKSLCNRNICETLTYGIAESKIAYIDGAIGKMMLGGLTKILTDPPTWTLDVNGMEVSFTTAEIMEYGTIRTRVMENVDIIAPPMKKEDWLGVLETLMADKKTIAAPDDSGITGQIRNLLFEFLQMAKSSDSKDDIQRGIPAKHEIRDKPVLIFKSTDFSRFLKNKKFTVPPGNKLWLIMRAIGCDHGLVRVGKPTQVWFIDESKISYDEQKVSDSFKDDI